MSSIDSNIDKNNDSNIDSNVSEITPSENKGFLNKIIDFLKNNVFVVVLVVVLIIYILLFSSLGNNINSSENTLVSDNFKNITDDISQEFSSEVSNNSDSEGRYLFELLLWSIFVLLILLNGVLYIFNIDVITSVKNLFGNVPQVEIVVDSDGFKKVIPAKKKEVYHIPDNVYDYETAKAICKARDSRLATYQELSDAYDKGADWCGYGWSQGQMALFPTQMEKWEKLQKIEGHENDCGRPGINGGYIDNPNVKYGINCYGYKHDITPEEAKLMIETPLYPNTKKEIEFNNKVEYWKKRIPDILLSPFSHNNWSIF
tara:strand:+ start:1278 stop:2225 length:948 start_codon:yes stop_codon:yes gene_type:complete